MFGQTLSPSTLFDQVATVAKALQGFSKYLLSLAWDVRLVYTKNSLIISLESGHSLQLRGETVGDTLVTASYAGLSATAPVSVVPLNVVALQVESANSQI